MEETHNKIKYILSKFPDGEKRFRESAIFNKVIQCLIRDVDPMVIIDQLIDTTERTQKAFTDYAQKAPMPPIILPELEIPLERFK